MGGSNRNSIMKQEKLESATKSTAGKVYSAPRRFDLATLFVLMIVYSCLLGLFVGIGLPDGITFSILGFLTIVGVAQPVLFGGKSPRLASVIVGALALPLIFTVATLLMSREPSLDPLAAGVCSIPLGLCFGYLAGTLVGGVFLVAERLRRGKGLTE